MRLDTAIFVRDEKLKLKASAYENGSGIIQLKIGNNDIRLFFDNEAQFNVICAKHNIEVAQ